MMKRLHQPEDINECFQESWKRLSGMLQQAKYADPRSKRSIRRLRRCLKWCLAYARLQNHCSAIIKPYCPHASLMIKKFWIVYWKQHFLLDTPPSTGDFFEWYCDSATIREEVNLHY